MVIPRSGELEVAMVFPVLPLGAPDANVWMLLELSDDTTISKLVVACAKERLDRADRTKAMTRALDPAGGHLGPW
jgi:hypothetical protein